MQISLFVASLVCLAPRTYAQTLTLEQKVGQVMVWSFGQTELTPALRHTLTKYQPGGLIFFRRNITSHAQVARLTSALQKSARTPFFLMIDQEGGLVTRIRTATPLPSPLALAATNDAAFVRRFAAQSGEVLSEVGFNVNLAPVLDVTDPRRDSFIGNRAFGDDPDRVTELGEAFAHGLADAGVLPVAKHFPGHGGVRQNSHKTTPKKMCTRAEWEARDRVPFEAFAEAEYPRAIMTAHLSLPIVDPSGLPATYSRVIIEDGLRRDLDYDGLIVTDDLEMSGAAISPDPGERAVRAFLAGNDLLMFAGSPRRQIQAFEGLLRAVRDGRVPMERLDQSVARITAAKARLATPHAFDLTRVRASLKKLDELSLQVLKKNFKAASTEARHAWPAFVASRAVPVLTGSALFYQKFRAAYPGAARLQWLTENNLDDVTRTLGPDQFAVYFASGNTTARWLNHLPRAQKARLIVINCNHAGEIRDQDAFLSVFNVNTYFTDSGTWLAQTLGAAAEVREPAGDAQ